jgi:bacterioferritin
MKGNEQIIQKLNDLLADELTAINQYMVHAEMCDDWGYAALAEATEKRAIQEMKHAETLIGRILFLEARPTVSNLHPMYIGAEVTSQLKNDHKAEQDAIQAYNEAIQQVAALGDNGTAEILKAILQDEEAHIDWIETQLSQIEQLGLQIYLAQQVR